VSPDLDLRLVESMRPLFGDFAESALQQQKAKLGMRDAMGRSEYLRLIEAIKGMCTSIAGPTIADRLYQGLAAIVHEGAR
jgi:hypothetical protein